MIQGAKLSGLYAAGRVTPDRPLIMSKNLDLVFLCPDMPPWRWGSLVSARGPTGSSRRRQHRSFFPKGDHQWEGQKGQVPCVLGGGKRQRPWRSGLRLEKLTLGTWNVTSVARKKSELLRKPEKFRLDISRARLQTHLDLLRICQNKALLYESCCSVFQW